MIRLGYIGNAGIECSPLLLALALWMILTDHVAACLTSLLALSLHEAAHGIMARGLGCRVERIQLQPFGFVARLERAGGWDGLAIAAAGPLFSLLMAMGCGAAQGLGDLPFLADFGQANLSIALVNLLPALPLDGGRMLRCLLQTRLSPRACIRVCAGLGLLAGTGLLLLGGALLLRGEDNATAAIFGLFLLLAAAGEFRGEKGARVEAMLRRQRAVLRGESLRVVHIGVHERMPIAAALRRTQAGAYTVIHVLDDQMRDVGQTEEATLLGLMGAWGGGTPIGRAIRIDPKPKG